MRTQGIWGGEGENHRRTCDDYDAATATRGVVTAGSEATAGPSPEEARLEAVLHRSFFDGMDAALGVLWQRYWVAALGVEEGVGRMALEVRPRSERWVEST